MVRHITAYQDQGKGWNGFDQAQPSQAQGAVGDLINLKTDDHGQSPAAQGEKSDGTDPKTDIGIFKGGGEMMS